MSDIFQFFSQVKADLIALLFILGISGIFVLKEKPPADGGCPVCNGTGKLSPADIRVRKIFSIFVFSFTIFAILFSLVATFIKAGNHLGLMDAL